MTSEAQERAHARISLQAWRWEVGAASKGTQFFIIQPHAITLLCVITRATLQKPRFKGCSKESHSKDNQYAVVFSQAAIF